MAVIISGPAKEVELIHEMLDGRDDYACTYTERGMDDNKFCIQSGHGLNFIVEKSFI